MNVDLIRTTTEDGLRLDGALYRSAGESVSPSRCDALLCLHGVGGNFYTSSLFDDMTPRFLEMGLAVAVVNTRGRDGFYAATTLAGRRMFGSAYERVEECSLDVAAWAAALAERGLRRIGLVGHSLGGVKAVYSQAVAPHRAIACLIGASPPQLSATAFLAGPEKEQFQPLLQSAEEHVAAGRPETLMSVRFPSPLVISAGSYVEKYGREDRFDILRHAPRLSVPALFTYGGQELMTGGTPFAGLPERLAALSYQGPRPDVRTIASADHMYTGRRRELAEAICQWLFCGAWET